jgi:hypothetical protein
MGRSEGKSLEVSSCCCDVLELVWGIGASADLLTTPQ